jgi:hypothetical protein
VKVGESHMKVQYFKYDALLVENGRKFTIFNPGVSDVISRGAVIPWRLGKKVKSKFIGVCCIMILLELTLTCLNNTRIVSLIGAWSSQRVKKFKFVKCTRILRSLPLG